MNRIRVLLLFGGESAEHDVSIASARNVYAALDDRKYEVDLCYISRDGHWHLVDDIEQLEGQHPLLSPVLGGKHFVAHPSGRSIVPQVLLPILHGPNGEDGSVQGLAQLLHIPVVGCGVLGSAVCMDKEVAKRLLVQADIPVADFILHRAHEPLPSFAHLTLKLGNPLFVKPASQGSSVGVHRVHDEAAFTAAMSDAHTYDDKVLIEQAITGREVECAILGNAAPEASSLGEIRPHEGNFYSYEEKYSPHSKTELVIPADIPKDVAEQVQQTALAAYRALECRGLARVDFFVTDEGRIYVNEVNTMPGFTNISMYPKLWRASGLGYSQLIDRLITLALERHAN
jgi:D-alanine-D-alanine ligase